MRRVGAAIAALSSCAVANLLDDGVDGAMLLQMKSSPKQGSSLTLAREGSADAVCENVQGLHLGFVKHSNLDGKGEGAAQLTFGGVTTKADGTVVDLVVTGENYNSKKSSRNFVNRHGIGMLNMDCGSQAEFFFNFVNADTGDAVLPTDVGGRVMLNFFDIDQGKDGRGREQVMLCGVSNAIMSADSELEYTMMDDCATVTSTVSGTAADNPSNQASLTGAHKRRAVSFVIASSTSFGVTIGVSDCYGNRGVLFGGNTGALCPAIEETVEHPPLPKLRPVTFTPPVDIAVTAPPVTHPPPVVIIDPPHPPPQPLPTSWATPPPMIHMTAPPMTYPPPVVIVDPPHTPLPEEAEEEEEEGEEEEEPTEDDHGFCAAHGCGNGRACCVRRNGQAYAFTRSPNRRKRRNCTRPRNIWCRKMGGMMKKSNVNVADFADLPR